MTEPVWHLLQVSDVLDLELASALSGSVPLIAWEPARVLLPARIAPGEEEECVRQLSAENPGVDSTPSHAFRVRKLPLLRGFARPPMSWLARTGPAVLARLLRQTPDPESSPLICSTPYFAPVAELWPGPVVYWLTDLIAEYSSANRNHVIQLDCRLTEIATLVCPNSTRLRTYLIDHANCDPDKIHILPNATRAANVLPCAPIGPGKRPAPLASLRRPIAGIIGNLAGNMDWLLLERLVQLTPWLSWVFVGPTSMHIVDASARSARERLMAHPNTHFLGRQPYGSLVTFARCFDVAVLPYRRCEPTFSGSSTRFYEHLAACRPMLATRGLEELLHKVPLLTLVDTAEQALTELNRLRKCNFNDGLTELRWRASHHGTWEARAASLLHAFADRIGGSSKGRPALKTHSLAS